MACLAIVSLGPRTPESDEGQSDEGRAMRVRSDEGAMRVGSDEGQP